MTCIKGDQLENRYDPTSTATRSTHSKKKKKRKEKEEGEIALCIDFPFVPPLPSPLSHSFHPLSHPKHHDALSPPLCTPTKPSKAHHPHHAFVRWSAVPLDFLLGHLLPLVLLVPPLLVLLSETTVLLCLLDLGQTGFKVEAFGFREGVRLGAEEGDSGSDLVEGGPRDRGRLA